MSVDEGGQTRAPRGLKGGGRAFWRRVTAVFVLSESETVVLREVCRSIDLIAELESVLERDGSTVTGTGGATKTHPHVAELRQQRAALAKLLAVLALPGEDGTTLDSLGTQKARKAAQTRWRSHNTGVVTGG